MEDEQELQLIICLYFELRMVNFLVFNNFQTSFPRVQKLTLKYPGSQLPFKKFR